MSRITIFEQTFKNLSRMRTRFLKTSLKKAVNIFKIKNLTDIFSIHTQIYPNLR